MAKEQEQNQNSINIPGGLNTDSSLVNQPQGTTRFVMTGVNETKEGDLGFIANEESNQECYNLHSVGLSVGYIPIGKVYIGDENNLIFLANPNGHSAAVILDKECNVTLAFTDETQIDQTQRFGFKVTQQIDATFRLRRGCERSVYWIDPKPRMYILDKEEEFKVDDPLATNIGDWDISKFGLFKTYKKIPEVTDIEVIDGGGVLPAGSYNFSIRYLDADFNPTEFITSTETIMIYNEPLTTTYRNIVGTTKEDQAYYNFPDSNKAIKISLDPLTIDLSFPFYQLAITEANAGGGLISDTKFTSEISTRQPTFYYTGVNYESTGSQEEVTMFNNIIEKAETIEQIENRLVLGNIQGKQINYCTLQKYASRIAADMVTKDIYTSVLDLGNSKDPSAHFNGIGYMPGEIYSFGIVYIFEDNSVSPVFHIPGKSHLASVDEMYSTGDNVYPMSTLDNACLSTKYIDNNTCGQDTFWGEDYYGTPLTNKPVRHHRFPLRTDYDIPFVNKVDTTDATSLVKALSMAVTKADAVLPRDCPSDDTGCTPDESDFGDPVGGGAFEIQIDYVEDSVTDIFSSVLDPRVYVGETTDTSPTADVSFNFNTGNIYASIVSITTLTEIFEQPTVPTIVTLTLGTNPITGNPQYTGTSGTTGLTYTIDVTNGIAGTGVDLFQAKVFGIKFSNVWLPDLSDTDGQKVVGYYIVRNERKQSDKSILDSAVLLPTATEKNFVAQGLIFPQYATQAIEDARIKKDMVGFISPEHKFNGTQYAIFSQVIHQGQFKKIDVIKSRVKINDVADGSGYQSGKHKNGESDHDGFTLHVKTRDNITNFQPRRDFTYTPTDIKQVFYLDALEDKLVEDSAANGCDVFNLACDNRTGIMTFNQNYSFNCLTALPYVYLCRNIVEPYSNFRLEPYYKDSRNPEKFDILTGLSTCEIFNGDVYINSMRYVNSIYYDTRMKKRKGKTNAFGFILAAVLVIVAVALVIFSFGAATPLAAGLLVAGAGLAAGVATTLVLSGIKQDAWNKAYNVLYKQGLRTTIVDNYLEYDIDPNNNVPVIHPFTGNIWFNKGDRGNKKNPSDDEVQWLGDCVNLWFESTVNMGLRNGFNDATPSFLRAPGLVQQGTTYPEWNREYFGIMSVGSGDKDIDGGARNEDVVPTTALDFHMTDKLTYLDAARKSGRKYYGISLSEAYLLNLDYTRRNKQKAYFHLGLEYDCCTDCVETFPHRFHWSEQAFQEELTDNFRMFLPNNYKDLEAETGPITDIYRIGNSLYIHTAEGLWHCPQTFQERVTQDIISFIGTGEYFSVPPRKIVDDTNSSAGNSHKWARTKTKYGVLFPSYKEKKWYLFNGEQLQPISDNGNANYFKTHMDFLVEQQFYAVNQQPYPYSNNPSNPIGVGFLSTYDTNKERLIVTKKDSKIMNLPSTAYELCTDGEDTVIFTNMAQTIADRAADGWTYVGIEDCKMKFTKVVDVTSTVLVNQFTEVANDIDIYVFYDTSGSFGFTKGGTGTCTKDEVLTWGDYFPLIDASLTDWIDNDLAPSGWQGQLYRNYDSFERWLQFPNRVPLVDRNKVIVISFTNESNSSYHGRWFDFASQPTGNYIADYIAFTQAGGIYSTYTQFIGINYPICTNTVFPPETQTFVQHALAAVKGTNYTSAETNELPVNLYFPTADWTQLKSNLLSNPYSSLLDPNGDAGLEQYNWFVKPDRSVNGNPATIDCEATNVPGAEVIISPCQFAVDMNEILASLRVTEEIETTVTNPVVHVEYEEGEVFVPQIVNAGWTMSYSLKKQEWVGWHPYIPSFYIHVQEKFYSWPQGAGYLFKHNRPNHYQTFYGVYYPFIVEYVDNPSALITKTWDHILFQTEAKKYDPASQDYYDQRDITFNKAIFYNTEQTSGMLYLQPKFNSSLNYLLEQTTNNNFGVKTIDRNERDWTMNDLRSIRDNYAVPMFIKDPVQLQGNYYIDKVVNPSAINYNLDWTQLETFRDKFLVVRLIFDTFADTRLIFNFSALDKKQSER